MSPDYLTTTQAAAIIGVTLARVRQYIAGGLLKGERFGRVWTVRRAEVDGFKRPRGSGRPRRKPLPPDCGRYHPQPYCCCIECYKARGNKSINRKVKR